MLVAAAFGAARTCAELAAWALVSDALDGPLARALGVASERGARFDSAADCALYLSAPWVALGLSPWLRANASALSVAIFAAYAIPICYGMIKFGRLTSYHTAAARVAGVLVVVAALVVFVAHVAWPLYVAAALLVASAIEEIAITYTLEEWRAEVLSLSTLPSPSSRSFPMQERTYRQAGGFRFALTALTLIAVAVLPQRAAAQVSVGGYLGGEFDNQSNWLLFGADARVPLAMATAVPLNGQARLTYHSYGGGFSSTQIDANLLLPLQLAHPGQFKPYVGAGVVYIHESGDGFSDSKVGLNLITGTDVDLSPGSPVFGIIQTQYSIVREFPNSYTLVLGLGVHLGGGGTKKK